MIKRLTIYFSALIAIVAINACNDKEDENIDLIYGSTQVKSFRLGTNDSILENLDSVYFSIDLVNSLIFNADSLPYGTPTDSLLVDLTTDQCSAIELKFKTKSGKDTTVNYMTNSTQPIDFSNGPITLHLVSFDTKAQQDYTIKVNVHTVVSDSLYWDLLSRRSLPSALSNPTVQKTVKFGDTAYCLTSDDANYSIAFTDNPDGNNWQHTTPQFQFTPKVQSFEATDEAFYILDSENNLYRSTDVVSWSATGCKFSHIYGAYCSQLLGVATGNDGLSHHAQYSHPQFTIAEASIGDCPVSGTSQLAMFNNKWSDQPQLTMLGGRTADGSLSSAAWGYDGNNWAKLSDSFPVKAEGINLIPYYVTATDSLNWTTSRTPALIAFGGRTDKNINPTLYISRDYGVNWSKAESHLQLPSYLPPSCFSQALIYNTTYTSNATKSAWKRFSPRDMKPITQWETPFIYMFGGYDYSNGLFQSIWKGVINSLTFKPLQ